MCWGYQDLMKCPDTDVFRYMSKHVVFHYNRSTLWKIQRKDPFDLLNLSRCTLNNKYCKQMHL